MRRFSSSLAWRHIRDLASKSRPMLDAWRKFLGGRRFVADDCPIEFEQKKIHLDAYINGTPPSSLKRRKFYFDRIGNKSEQSPNKIEEQIGWAINYTPPTIERNRNKNTIIWKNSGSIYMEFHFREGYGS